MTERDQVPCLYHPNFQKDTKSYWKTFIEMLTHAVGQKHAIYFFHSIGHIPASWAPSSWDRPSPPPEPSSPLPPPHLHFHWRSGPQNFQQGALSANADVKALKLVQG